MRALRSCLLLSLLLAPSLALAAPGWVFEKVALSGESAPGTARNYDAFDNARSAGADTAWHVILEGTPFQWGVYRSDGGVVSPISLVGELAPDAGGGTYALFFGTPQRKAGFFSFAATIDAGSSPLGLFVDDGVADAAVMLSGDLLPGGGSFAPTTGDLAFHSVNASGDVAFRSTLSGAGATQGLFRVDSGGLATIAELGAPGPVGGTWDSFGAPSINDAGEVAFDATLVGGGAASAIYVFDGSSVDPLVQAGDPAPDTGGAVFDLLVYPAMGNAGKAAFLAGTVGGSATGGLFVASPSIGIQSLVVENQVMPQTGGRSIVGLGQTLPNLNAAGSSAFAGTLSGTPAMSGVFLYDGNSDELKTVALTGETAPDAGGATFSGFEYIGLDDLGVVSFEAALSDGRSGIFTAMPGGSAVPSVGPIGAAGLSLLLAGAASARLSRRENRRSRRALAR